MNKLALETTSLLELLSYKIALLTMVANCNDDIKRIEARIKELKEKEQNV
jgi:hypothetical protein